ncbi:MAG TPA: hypothetical protein VKI44_11080 [Acetobacteraceae bacterium]|nr:hypothetical protein [Acetobacteraceae bacterium]
MKTILSAAAALAIIIGSSAAFADSGDGPQFAVPQPVPATGPSTTIVSAATVANDVGSEAQAVFAGQPAIIEQGTASLLSSNGNEGIVQSANSAPAGFATDTVALAARASEAPQLALR